MKKSTDPDELFKLSWKDPNYQYRAAYDACVSTDGSTRHSLNSDRMQFGVFNCNTKYGFAANCIFDK